MKKRVKLYKSPDGNGRYINKTAQFLQKAQEGGMPNPDAMGYPQGNSQPNQDDVVNMIVTDISNGVTKNETMVKLINVVGLGQQEAEQMFEGVNQQLQQNDQQAEQEEIAAEEETPADPNGNPEFIENQPVEEEEEESYDYSGEEDVDVLEGDVEGIESDMYQDGGDISDDFGSEYSITLPDISAYLPTMPFDGDNGNPYAEMAWQMPQTMMAQDAEADYTEPVADMDQMRMGGFKKAKTAYVKSVMNLVKKQMGGNSVSEESSTDPTGSNYRNAKLKSFVGDLKNNATMSIMKENLEKQFEQMYQEGGMTNQFPGYEVDPENPMHHLQLYSQATQDVFGDPMNQTTKAQFGGGLFNRRQRQPNMGYFQRRGMMNPMMPPIESIDVRRSGIFGRPKEYSVTFGKPQGLPGGPNQGVGFYGYGATLPTSRTVITKAKVITEAAKEQNNKATEEVAKQTTASDATQKSADTPTQKEGTVTTNTGDGGKDAVTVQKPGTTTSGSSKPAGTTKPGVRPTKPTTPGQTYVKPVNVTPGLDNVIRGIQTYEPVKVNNWRDPIQYRTAVAAARQRGQTSIIDQKTGQTIYPPELKYTKGTNWGNIMEDNFKYEEDIKNKIAYYKAHPDQIPDNLRKAASLRPNDPNLSWINKAPKAPKPKPVPQYNSGMGSRMGMLGYEEGGVIDYDQMNMMEGLQRFIYGGDEDPSIPYIDQSDIDYSNSEDTTDPYFQRGGFMKNFFPANIYGSGVAEIQGMQDVKTGQSLQGFNPANGSYISNINVGKTGIFGRPKEYSVEFTNPGDPRKENLISAPGENKPGATLAPKPAAGTPAPGRAQSNSKTSYDFPTTNWRERMAERQVARGERRLGTPEEQAWEYYKNQKPDTLPTRPLSSMGRVYGTPKSGAKYSTELYDLEKRQLGPRQPIGAAYGGTQPMFVQNGGFTGANPVVYTDNPALQGMSDVQMITLNPGIQGLSGGIDYGQMSATGTVTQENAKGLPNTYGAAAPIAPNQPNNIEVGQESFQAQRQYMPEKVKIDVKNRLSNEQLEGRLNTGNAIARGITGFKNRRDESKQMADFYDNFNADNLYASDPNVDRGDYSESGLYRPNEQGQVWNSRSKQYGGALDPFLNEDPDYVEGDEVYMSDDEINDFLANGGEIEYI